MMNRIRLVTMAGTGYGEAGARYVDALRQVGVQVDWIPLNFSRGVWRSPVPAGSSDGENDYDTLVMHTVPELYPEWVKRERRSHRRMIGLTVWETNKLPPHWPSLLNQMDAIVVPSEWNRQVFERCEVRCPVRVVPHPCDDQPLSDRNQEWGIPRDHRVVYVIGRWTRRKGLDLAVRAFSQCCKPGEKVTLVVKTDWWNFSRRWSARWQLYCPVWWSLRRLTRKQPSARVRLLTRRLKAEQMRQLHQRGDIYFSLARGEGWGLGAFDAATLGRPLITTRYGGHLDYADPDHSWLVDYEPISVDEPEGTGSYLPEQTWAEPDLRHAATQLRWVLDNFDEANDRAEDLAGRIRERFAPSAVGRTMLAALASVATPREHG